MKVKNIKIEGVGGIENLTLDLNDNMNLICGPNGIGKTTLLEVISHVFFNGYTQILKRNVGAKKSIISVNIENNGENESKIIEFDTFEPEKNANITSFHQYASGVITFKTARVFNYQTLQAVSKDINKEQNSLWNEAKLGINLNEIKNWFVNRFLYSAHKDALKPESINNLELAKKCFSILDSSFTFSKVDAATNEILINTKSGEIYYEYLSSGFKSIISILFGIIKEIEYRFTEPRINASDFNGIILIDELELHLHPEWQGKIVDILLQVFPNAQFIVSTHSPHIIQAASTNQIIALERIENKVIQRNLPSSSFGFKGWSIEEVLIDIMGMKDTRTELYNETLSLFNSLMDNEKYKDAKQLFSTINEFLHPENHLRKIIEIQLTGLEND
jgi:predicted ATP-binding protein involved in virulence